MTSKKIMVFEMKFVHLAPEGQHVFSCGADISLGEVKPSRDGVNPP